jgi:hypothetical protein
MQQRAEAQQRQAAAAQAQGEAQLAKACDEAVDGMNYLAIAPEHSMCKDPKYQARYCKQLETVKGFALASGDETQLARGAQACRKDPAALRARLCPAALQEAQAARPPREVLHLVGKSCPDQRQALAEKECAGRSYTGLEGSYREFCTEYARELLGRREARPAKGQETPSSKDEAVNAGKKALKGLFGR